MDGAVLTTQEALLQAIHETLKSVYPQPPTTGPVLALLRDSILIALPSGDHYLVTVRPVELAYK